MPVLTAEERTAAIAHHAERVSREDRKWVRGAFHTFPIQRVPVEHLVLNADNRRFTAEKLRWEEELGRPLDPLASEADAASLISILLDDSVQISDDQLTGKPSKDALALIEDFSQRGQEQPLWIRPDGYVINGNRRLAALKRLAEERGSATGTFNYVEVIILPFDEIDDTQLFEMEAREQLTEGYKIRYSDINLLLTLREAAERHEIVWGDDESVVAVARRIQDLVGNDARYAEVQLAAIRYMDEYLAYTGESGLYQRLIGQVERFRDIAKNMKIVLKETPELALDMLTLQFQAVQAGLGHMDIRELRKLALEDPARLGSLSREVEEIVAEPDAGESEPDVPLQEDLFGGADSEDTLEDAPPPPSPSFPRTRVKRALDIAIEARKSRQRNDPELALRGAAERLGEVTAPQVAQLLAGAAAASTRTALAKIRAWVVSVDDASE